MKKISRGAYEATKGFLRVAETLLEVLILTVVYYLVWKNGYSMFAFEYKGKYVLMGVYGLLAYLIFQNADCTMFGQLNRVDQHFQQCFRHPQKALGSFICAATYFFHCLSAHPFHISNRNASLNRRHIL